MHPFHMPVDLADIIDTHRRLFGGLVMMADEPAEKTEDKPAEKTEGDKPEEKLQEGGLKALQAERDARKALEAKVKELEGAKGVLDKLAEVFAKDGQKPDPNADLAAQVAELLKRDEDAKAEKARDALARQVAKANDIIDVTDIELLAKQADEDAMKALAARLKGVPAARGPKPDPSQGKGGSGSANGGSVTAGRDLYHERHTTKTTS